MTEISFGQDEDPVTEYEHVYEISNNGSPQRLRTGKRESLPLTEAASVFEVPEEDLTWVLTREYDSNGNVSSATVPCSECGEEVWVSERKAAKIQHSTITISCGSCAVAKRSGDAQSDDLNDGSE